MLDLLAGIDTVFAASSPEYKNRILRAVFPEGFTIDAKAEKVRTPCVNDILYELCSKSINCSVLEIENGTELAPDPVKGTGQIPNSFDGVAEPFCGIKMACTNLSLLPNERECEIWGNPRLLFEGRLSNIEQSNGIVSFLVGQREVNMKTLWLPSWFVDGALVEVDIRETCIVTLIGPAPK